MKIRGGGKLSEWYLGMGWDEEFAWFEGIGGSSFLACTYTFVLDISPSCTLFIFFLSFRCWWGWGWRCRWRNMLSAKVRLLIMWLLVWVSFCFLLLLWCNIFEKDARLTWLNRAVQRVSLWPTGCLRIVACRLPSLKPARCTKLPILCCHRRLLETLFGQDLARLIRICLWIGISSPHLRRERMGGVSSMLVGNA